jgi:DNA-binding Lrp family transcriptional regulator
MTALDGMDRALLDLLQRDGAATAESLGRRLGLSASQVARRRARLEAAGVVRSYGARLDAAAVGLGVQAFVQVQMAVHDPNAARPFGRVVELQPEIVAAWTLTGEADYLLRVRCEDLPALNRLIHDVLLPHPAVARVQSQIVMAELKADAPLPL